MTDLSQLANRFGSGKGTAYGACMSYTVVYDMLFFGLRKQNPVDLLEIGLAEGGPEVGGDADRIVPAAPSLSMWRNYFDCPRIVGFDISDFSPQESGDFVFIRGDAGSQDDLGKVKGLDRQFDIIIDDASHASYHQQLALATLFECVKPGGFYIIEDLDWVPKTYEAELPKVPLTRDLLTQVCRTGALTSTRAISETTARSITAEIHALHLYDEFTLSMLGRGYNMRNGIDVSPERSWRKKSNAARIFDPYFAIFNLRRLRASFDGEEFVTRKNLRLAVLQKLF